MALTCFSKNYMYLFICLCLYGKGYSHGLGTACVWIPAGTSHSPLLSMQKACQDEQELPSPGQSQSTLTSEGQEPSGSPRPKA